VGTNGRALLKAANQLRMARNIAAHGSIEALSPVDLAADSQNLLALIDGLAYWADHPLMYGVRNHPDDRSRLQFQKIVGSTFWPVADLVSDVPPLKNANRRTTIQFLHHANQSARLIDLFPFVSMVEQAGKPPTPALLLPRPSGAVRRSLATGEEIPNAPATPDERAALRHLFGIDWSG
jgi:hypothetical protein